MADLDGKAKNARITLDRIRKIMHVFKDETHRNVATSSGKFWHTLHAINDYLTGQDHWRVNLAMAA